MCLCCRAFGHLCCVSSLVESLQAMALVHDISPLLHYLLPLLVHSVVTERYGTDRAHMGWLDMAAGCRVFVLSFHLE